MEHLSPWQIKLAKAYVEHKFMLQRLFLFSLFILDIVFIATFAINFARYNGETIKALQLERIMARNYVNFEDYKKAHPVLPLQPARMQALEDQPGVYNLFAAVTNRNLAWGASALEYRFVVDGIFLPWREGFILPGETKPLLDFGFSSRTGPQAVGFNLRNVVWQRVDKNSLAGIADEIFVKDVIISRSSPGTRNQYIDVAFSAVNDSAYDFWSGGFTVVGTKGGKVIAVGYVTIENFDAKTERPVTMRWPGQQIFLDAEISPDFNLLDTSTIRTPSRGGKTPSGAELEKR